MDKFTIVIPVFNEAKNLKVLIPKIFKELRNKVFEIIIVDDNSNDETYNILKKFKKKNHELENNFLPLLVKKNLLTSVEHRGYFYSINDKKELLIAQTKLKKK